MFDLKARLDIRGVERKLKRIKRDAVPKAAARALNRARNTARTDAIRKAARRLGVTQKPLRRRIFRRTQVNASKSRLQASMKFGILPIAVSKLGRIKRTSRGVTVGSIGEFDGAFTIPVPGGKLGVVERFGERTTVNTRRFGVQFKQRIRKVTFDVAPSIKEAARKAVRSVAKTAFRKRYLHELKRELKRAR